MNDAKTMCFLEHVADLRRNLDGPRRGETSFVRKQLRECFAFDELHHDEVTAVGKRSGVEDHRRVRMMQLRHRSCFAQKTICNVSVGCEFAFDDFDCYGAVESEMSGEVNSAHAAGPDFAFDPEPASDELGDIHIDLPCRIKGRTQFQFFRGWGKRSRSLARNN